MPLAVPVTVGDTYGMLTVLAYPIRQGGFLMAQVRCECGTIKLAKACNLARGRQKCCGCLNRMGGRARPVHNMAHSPEYKAWSAAKKRCSNPNDPRYVHYGGRGIRMCDEWKADFQAFFADLGPRPQGRYTLERLDLNKGYEPGNCVWATYRQQNRNLRSNVKVSRSGRDYFLADLADAVGLNRNTVFNRRSQYKWPERRWLEPFTIEEAIAAYEAAAEAQPT